MKKLTTFAIMTMAIILSSCKYNDDDIWNSVHNLEGRVAKLEELCQQMNTNVSSLHTIVTALQSNDYITGITPIVENGKEIGYTITFSKSDAITIYHGRDGHDGIDGTNGSDGADGVTPVIGVRQDVDGIYYWTLNGDWLTDDSGNKIKAEGTDGKDGADGADGSDGTDGTDGTNGQDGQDGQDGITPKFKIENDYWFISYDNGATWTQLGKATGEDGADGVNGDSIFKGVTQDDDNVYFELADGSVITVSKSAESSSGGEDTKIITFKDETVKNICVANWDINGDGELSRGEAARVTSIRKFFRGTDIKYFEELQYFTGIDEIGEEAFKQCHDLISIVIPDNVLWIEDNAFNGCVSLLEIVIPDYVTWIGTNAFSNCSGLKDIIIGSNVSTIGSYAFMGCTSLENIIIPNCVRYLGASALKGCSELVNIVISDKIASIKNNTFSECSSLLDIVIPDSVTSIGSSAFQGCSSLTEIVIPDSVTSIESSAFRGCSSLTEIVIPDNVTSIGSSAFEDCTNLTSVIMGIGVIGIGNSAFSDCSSLSSVTIGRSVTSIGMLTFDRCSSLTEIVIPEGVIFIGSSAFSACGNLQKIYCTPTIPPTLESNSIFSGIYADAVIYVPQESVDSYKSAVDWSNYAGKIVGYAF